MIGPDKVAEIRDRTDVVALIGENVALKRAGAQFKGLCPFHAEKSPSFHVHPERQFFHCFGCGASGDAIAFVMRLEGRTFPEALRTLAERAGVELEEESEREDSAVRQARLERERLLAVLDAAAGFYIRQLTEHEFGWMPRQMLTERGTTDEAVQTFRLGYAPHGWDSLGRFLASRGHSPRDAELAGLLAPRKSGGGHYDRFRHRLMFPISDVHGRIVGFSGRALPPPPGEPTREGQDPPAKYVNSPESSLYKKGELLFGLHEARVHLRREGRAMLCEGNFDVLALHQAGKNAVVAPLGTALTAAQSKLLRRYVSRVTVVFDGDDAGRKATRAAYPLLAAESLTVSVASLPKGEDPDSFLRSEGADALAQRIETALPVVEYLIESAALEAGADPSEKAKAIQELGPVLASVENPVERTLYVERVAHAFELRDHQAVREQLRRGVRLARASNSGRSSKPVEHQVPKRRAAIIPDLEKGVVGACLDEPSIFGSDDIELIERLLTSHELRVIVQLVRDTGLRRFSSSDVAEAKVVVNASALMEAVAANPVVGESSARSWLEERLAKQTFEDPASARTFVASALPVLHRRWLEREVRSLEPLIKQARLEGDAERADELMRRRDELFRLGHEVRAKAAAVRGTSPRG